MDAAIEYRLSAKIRSRIYQLKYHLNAAIGEFGRKLVRFSQRDSNYLKHARSEWSITFPGHDEMQARLGEHVLDMVAMFGLEGHSGFSAGYARKYIDAALKFEPFSPLTGADSEWGEPFSFDGSQQNRRCSHVFRRADGSAYDSRGKVFVEPSGAAYTSSESFVPITFPYVPTVEYVQVAG